MSTAPQDVITIVSGLPRSGTSMMMAMIDAGGIPALTDNLRKADADNPRGYYEYEPVKQTKQDPSWLAHAGGRVVKMVYRLLYDLPPGRHYRVIFMQRHLEEVIKSQDVMLEHRGQAGGPLSPDKLIALFRQQLEQFDQWVRRQPHFEILYINYNEIIRDPAAMVQNVNRFLGGHLDVAAMQKVVEPTLYRQRARG
jgi:hypothetical protein